MLLKKKPLATRTEVAANGVRDQAAALREKAAPLASAAGERATSAANSAKDWAAPRLAQARDIGLEKAAPRVEQAAKALGPRVDAAHDRFIDEVLPKVVDLVNSAAAAATSKADEAARASHAGLDQVAHTAAASRPGVVVVKRRRRRVGKGLIVLGAFAALGGVAFALIRRLSGPTEDPWAAPVNAPLNPPATAPTPSSEEVLDADSAPEGTDPGSGDQVGTSPSAALTDDEVSVVEEIDGNEPGTDKA